MMKIMMCWMVLFAEVSSFKSSGLTIQREKMNHLHRQQQDYLPFLHHRQHHQKKFALYSSNDDDDDDTSAGGIMDDETLLKQVTKAQLQDLCSQCSLSFTNGETKKELLLKLRKHAQEQAEVDTQKRQERKERIERGYDLKKDEEEDEEEAISRAKHKIIQGDNDDEDEEEENDMQGVFYFQAPPGFFTEEELNRTSTKVTSTVISDQKGSNNPITAPPPPPGKGDKDGIRTVTTYSSSDRNDLTGMQTASSLMMDNTQNDGIAASTSKQEFRPEDTLAAGPFGSNDSSLSNKKQTASEKEINEAKEEVTELVASLLALSGAPAFVEEYYGEENASSKYEFVGFDPSRVPPNLLSQPSSSGSASAASKALRTGEKDGQVLLQSILSDFEMRAIGHDGMAADNKKRGGGHYTEVRKVGAFLEGYRRAEVKRISRNDYHDIRSIGDRWCEGIR
uniref:SAP domain-containing protein n=1 Tax=Ditylum brightwellii TaxID=49249 RepID=A0A7S4SBV9_9STRA